MKKVADINNNPYKKRTKDSEHKKGAQKETLLKELSEMPDMVVATAYLHAIKYTKFGVDVTEHWLTAVQQTVSLDRAYRAGYEEGLRKANEMFRKKIEQG